MKTNTIVTSNFRLILYAAAVMVLMVLLDLVGVPVKSFGIIPHSEMHLIGILTSPFIHSGWPHLSGNLMGLAISGYLMSKQAGFKRVTLGITLTTGLCVWLFAGSGNHIGASGVIMGFYGYLIGVALFKRNLIGIVTLAVLVVLTYYANISFFATLLDFSEQTSSSGHLFGFGSGLGLSYVLRHKN
ncbi:rhomboid family intramembrane serine protease [Pseudoalteromonas luteoviolacea]|uniref:rhomboid family intramembrane serine protease n=1 Tax=Pseudoalteromonas luteoviolacea TaxID=43657 RepID=UPI001B39CA3B|nr:rhomboid family intramembrane serine protease [Pseudoalteromonas luteoviolacea]MBQ4814096.1 rhomboid family intramembrane serine protease [Pseudoalteromonas luteoviolacea]